MKALSNMHLKKGKPQGLNSHTSATGRRNSPGGCLQLCYRLAGLAGEGFRVQTISKQQKLTRVRGQNESGSGASHLGQRGVNTSARISAGHVIDGG